MQPTTEFSPESAAKAYLPLMHEFGIRADMASAAFSGDLGLSPPFAREFAYLQFRRMCELIALGCLFLHGDLPIAQKNALAKEWHAEKLLKLLSKSYKYAFPQAIVRIETSAGWEIEANSNPDALSYAQFLELYSECGSVLHRGTVRTVQATGICGERDYERAVIWQRRLVTLMNEHLVTRATAESWYVVSIRTTSGYPECSVFHKVGKEKVAVQTVRMTVSDSLHHAYISNA